MRHGTRCFLDVLFLLRSLVFFFLLGFLNCRVRGGDTIGFALLGSFDST